MKFWKIILVTILVLAMALPVLADRRQPKVDAKALLASGRIALNSDPPRYEEALEYFNRTLTDHGMVPEAYYYKQVILAEYAVREYDLAKKLEFFTQMGSCHDSLVMACNSDAVKKNLKSDCGDFLGISDSLKLGYWRENYNDAVKTLQRIDDELAPNVNNTPESDSVARAEAQAALMAAADSSRAYFKIALAVDPVNYRPVEGLALVFDRMGQYDSSLAYFKKAAEVAPEESNLIQSVAYSYIQNRDWENAIVYFKQLLPLIQDQTELQVNTLFNVAICFNNLKSFDSSYIYNMQVLAIDSMQSDAWLDVGQYHLTQAQKYSDSVKYFKQANNKNEADRYEAVKNRTLDTCAFYLNQAVLLAPGNKVALEMGGTVDMISGNFEGAAGKFMKLTELEPNNKDFWLNLGDCYVQMQQFDKAMEPYEKVVELAPGNCDVWKTLESIYRTKNLTDKATKAAAKIKELGC